MSDGTQLNAGSGGDTIRTIAKTATGQKTQSNLIDVGGGTDASPEQIVGPLFGLPVSPFTGSVWSISGTITLGAGSASIGSVTLGNKPVGAAIFLTSQSNVTNSGSTQLAAARTGAPGTGRISITLYNAGATIVYYGASSGVNSSNGAILPPGGSITLDTTAAVFAISSSGSNIVCVTETA